MRKGSALELTSRGFARHMVAEAVSDTWRRLSDQRAVALQEWLEVRNYIFATSTSTTSNSELPWKNSTTIPKITQIRDNLHSNYISALFPNDKWLTWEAYTTDANTKEKAENIQRYMSNKCRMTNFRSDVSSLVYDYLDSGNAFGTYDFLHKYHMDFKTNEKTKTFIGPKAVRIAPEDIVFDATAPSFASAHKIVRSTLTLGEISRIAKDNPDDKDWAEAVLKLKDLRVQTMSMASEDVNKQMAFEVDGYGSFYEYLSSGYVEILTFYGDIFDGVELKTDQKVVIADRLFLITMEDIDTFNGEAPIFHTGWRKRPNNLWAMGPFANLVGMQYRLDHLENAKADAMDLIIHPPLKVIGDVEPFKWGPGEEIHLDENGDVQELGMNLNAVLSAASDMQTIMQLMELMSGSPREAMGFRSPGEKTAFEVGELMTAASRIFQEKITTFEMELLEPLLNGMYEAAIRNFDVADTIKVMNHEIGVEVFRTITKEDIAANGVLRPIGARNFAQKAQDLQNLLGIMNSPLAQIVNPHMSADGLISFVNDVLNLKNYGVFDKNAGLRDQLELQNEAMLAQGEQAALAETAAMVGEM